MIVATPFIPGITDYEHYASEFRRRGKLLNHTHVVISKAEDEQAAYQFSEQMSEMFFRTHTIELANIPRNGFQFAADLVRAALKFCHDYVPRDGELPEPPLLYMDPIYRPQKPSWVDLLQSEYFLHHKPMVLGRFSPKEEEVRLAQGPLVFNREFFRKSGLLPHIPSNIHWRTYLRHELLNNAVETKQIGPGSAESVLRALKKP